MARSVGGEVNWNEKYQIASVSLQMTADEGTDMFAGFVGTATLTEYSIRAVRTNLVRHTEPKLLKRSNSNKGETSLPDVSPFV